MKQNLLIFTFLLALISLEGVESISWNTPPQIIGQSILRLVHHNLSMNDLGHAALIYQNASKSLTIKLWDSASQTWTLQSLTGNADSITDAYDFSLNIGINNNDSIFAVWTTENTNPTVTNFARAQFGGGWTLGWFFTPTTFAGSVEIQAFSLNDNGNVVIAQTFYPQTLYAHAPHVFNGTSWDNLDCSVFFLGLARECLINNADQIILTSLYKKSVATPNDYLPQFAFRTVNGSWSAAAFISTDPNDAGTQKTTSLALNDKGQAVLCWATRGTPNKIRVATYTFGDASWQVFREDSTVYQYSCRTSINEMGQIVTTWHDGTALQTRVGTINNPFAQSAPSITCAYGQLGKLRNDGTATFLTTTDFNPGASTWGNVLATSFNATNLSLSAPVSFNVLGDIYYLNSGVNARDYFYMAANQSGDWLVIMLDKNSSELESVYGYSPMVSLSMNGKQHKNRFGTCTEYVNRLTWSVNWQQGISYFKIYRDGKLIATRPTDQDFKFDDREQKKGYPHQYKIQAISRYAILGETTVVVP